MTVKKYNNASNRVKKPFLLTALSVFMLAVPMKQVIAQITPAATPCDPAYYESMEHRAWLEAQREITQNQNLIFKPDSVLAYTCFHGYLNELADHAEDMFSENARWGTDVLGTSPPQNEHMNNALESLVTNALQTYINANFISPGDQRLLGGRSINNSDPIPANIANGEAYECEIMQTIWMEAKCYDFMTTNGDGFFTFEQYASGTADARMFPEPCDAEPTALYEASIVGAGLDPATGPPWPQDDTLTYLDRMDAAECGTFAPIATGVIVTRPLQTPQVYFEGVCLQPGCHYMPAGGATPGATPTASGSCVP